MKQADYVLSSLKWSGEGIKEQLRRIELDLNKIVSSKLGIYEEFIEINYLVKISQNLFSEFYKRLFLSMHITMSKLSLKKLYETYYVRSYFYIKKAFASFASLKNIEDIHESNMCRNTYTKIYKLTLLFDELEAKYKVLVNLAI
ncbi:MAG: hypothetical protein ACI4U5_03170 [Bacilli bacterium]